MAKLPEGLVDAIAKESKVWDEANPHTFDPASRSSKWRADRAKAIVWKAEEVYEKSIGDVFDKGGVVEPSKDVKEEDEEHKESVKTKDKEHKPVKTWAPTDASGNWNMY
jgi:hypothetical protein